MAITFRGSPVISLAMVLLCSVAVSLGIMFFRLGGQLVSKWALFFFFFNFLLLMHVEQCSCQSPSNRQALDNAKTLNASVELPHAERSVVINSW